MTHRKKAATLWVVSRSVSTALERVFAERGMRAGYEQHGLFRFAAENRVGSAVVDATAVTRDLEGVIRAYYEKPGDPFLPEALWWKPGEVVGWETWPRWHEEAQESNGVESHPLEDDAEVPAGLQGVLERCPFTLRNSAKIGCVPSTRPREPYG